jgi:lipopolysaccharide/colanic/teichoic acid biosynthesis glycosyltransferase
MDVVIALMALVLLAPTVLMIAALRTHAGRAIFDSEDYVGFNGRAFTSYTFATLPEEHASYWVRACLRILRDSRLDRLPLLFNVLRGDMSLVGPRPLRVRDLDGQGRRAQVYFAARPGLISLRHAGHGGRLAIDRYYVRRWSIWLDLVVLANAIMAVHRD